MLWHLYLRNGRAYLPSVGQTEAGFYLDIEPVEVALATDAEALQRAIKEVMSRGSQRRLAPPFPKPVVLKHAKVKSWSAFEKGALNWTIVEKSGDYQIKRGRTRPDGGWEDDPTRIESLPPGTAPEKIAERLASLVQAALGSSQQ